tara:strand:+ start:92 stop:307 length:216 start_codon:yes stop_codon:yes gene_type:complete
MKIEQRVTMKYHYCYFAFGGLEIEDINGNKIFVEMSDDQVMDLHERVEAKKEYILEKRKEKLEEENAETNS